MATTFTPPETQEAPAAESLAPKERKIRAWFKRTGAKIRRGAKKASLKVKMAGIKTGHGVEKAAFWTLEKVSKSAKWIASTTLYIAKGSAFYLMRGLGYVTFGLTWLVWGILRVAVLVIAFVAFVITLAVLAIIIVLMSIIRAFRRYVVGTTLWVAKGCPGRLRSMVARRPEEELLEHGTSVSHQSRMRFNAVMNSMLKAVFDDRVEVWDDASSDILDAWRERKANEFVAYDVRSAPLNEYADRTFVKVLEDHMRHAVFLEGMAEDPTDIAYWHGRAHMLMAFFRDNSVINDPKAVYDLWKVTDDRARAPKNGGLDKNAFKRGLEVEARMCAEFFRPEDNTTGVYSLKEEDWKRIEDLDRRSRRAGETLRVASEERPPE